MIILGVDPGLKATGYGVLETRDGGEAGVKVLETGIIAPTSRDPIQRKLAVLYQHLGEIMDQYRPGVLVLEKIYAHYKHPATACVLGHARGVICLLASQKGLNLVEPSVKRIRKAVLGNGNATKEQTRASVAHVLKIPVKDLTLDASDALALALGYVYMARLGGRGDEGFTGARR